MNATTTTATTTATATATTTATTVAFTFERGFTKYGVSSGHESAVVLTNRPGLLRRINSGTKPETSKDPRGDRRWSIVGTLEYEGANFGGKGDFIALLWRGRYESCGRTHDSCRVEALVGVCPFLDEILFENALLAWEESEIESARSFLAGFKCRAITNKVRHSLLHALGLNGSRYAPHEGRRRAWASVLTALSLEKVADLKRDGMNSITIKIARALGWRPSVLPPAPWDGVHGSITVIDPTSDAQACSAA